MIDWNKLADVLISDKNVKPLEYYEELYEEFKDYLPDSLK